MQSSLVPSGLSVRCSFLQLGRAALYDELQQSNRNQPVVTLTEPRRSRVTEPHYRTGKICYLEIPATDVAQSAEFYRCAFGWHVRQRGDGATSFDDTVGQVSGTWVTGRQPAADPGLIVYIMVASAAKAGEAVVAAGGEIVQPVDPRSSEVHLTFRDPAGNVLGIYQQPGLSETESQGTGPL